MNAPTTTAHIATAHLCGPLGQAIAVVDGETWIYENGNRRRASANDIRFFFDLGLEVRPVNPLGAEPLTEDKLSAMLERETRCFQALHDLLLGMDADLEDSLRTRAIRRADRLLADAEVAAFVERRFLRPVEREKWDVAGAHRLAAAERLSAVERLYAIVDGPLLLRVENEIADWLTGKGLTSVQRLVEIEKAYDSGLVAVLSIGLAISLRHNSRDYIRLKIIGASNISWDRSLAAHLVGRFAPAEIFRNGQLTLSNKSTETSLSEKRSAWRRVTEGLNRFRLAYREWVNGPVGIFCVRIPLVAVSLAVSYLHFRHAVSDFWPTWYELSIDHGSLGQIVRSLSDPQLLWNVVGSLLVFGAVAGVSLRYLSEASRQLIKHTASVAISTQDRRRLRMALSRYGFLPEFLFLLAVTLTLLP